MAYITNQDIIDRVGTSAAAQLTTDSGATPDQDVIDEVRNASEGEVNGYLAKRYTVPVDLTTHTDLADTLKSFTLDVAVYRLMGRRGRISESYKQAYENAKEWLTKVSEGKIVLPAATTPEAPTGDAQVLGYGKYRDNTSLANWN